MDTNQEIKTLRVYLSSTDKLKHTPLYESLVYMAKREGLAGATVLRGVMGFGASSQVHSSKFWELTQKLPMVVEIIDEAHKLENFLEKIKPFLEKVRTGCLVSLEDTRVGFFKPGGEK